MLDTELPHVSGVIKLLEEYKSVRKRTEKICELLSPEDHVAQPVEDVSPPKWHLAHTTWFFETFVLQDQEFYSLYHPKYSFLFNSYYNAIGSRVNRPERGNMTRPSVAEVLKYRSHVDVAMEQIISTTDLSSEKIELIKLGLQHEMQHQELLYTDLKFILSLNPLFPIYDSDNLIDRISLETEIHFLPIEEGIYEIGYTGEDFHFDNEKGVHRVFIEPFEIASRPVLTGEFLEFLNDGGYSNDRLWHSDAWAWLNQSNIKAPLYWHNIESNWMKFTLGGLTELNPNEIMLHLSYYEASAFANWKGKRLPTEFEWEVSQEKFQWGDCWEWTNSAYLPYPHFRIEEGAVGEYNGKFMVNQMVLRGASRATYPNHSRPTYRNFFHPHLRWQFSGVRLAKSL